MLVRYAGIIIAVLVIIVVIAGGALHVLPANEVSTVVQDAILYVLGHLVGVSSAALAPMLRRGKQL